MGTIVHINDDKSNDINKKLGYDERDNKINKLLNKSHDKIDKKINKSFSDITS
jgi:hypothetical protein